MTIDVNFNGDTTRVRVGDFQPGATFTIILYQAATIIF